MRNKITILVMIFAFVAICSAQNNSKSPENIIEDFWNIASQKNWKSIDKLILNHSKYYKENPWAVESDCENIKTLVKQKQDEIMTTAITIFMEKIKIKGLSKTSSSLNMDKVSYKIGAIGQFGLKRDAEMILVKQKNEWKIYSFELGSPKITVPPTIYYPVNR